VYTPAKANDILWCFGTQSQAYHCSVSRVISEAAAAGTAP
jgi:methylamine dehydrogenase light chain